MEVLAASNTLEIWLLQYGSIALFLLLAIGIIALPVPEETLMIIAGALIAHGKLHSIHAFFAAWFGSMCGISCSYMIGRLAGQYVLKHLDKFFWINQRHIDKAHAWFEHYGKWSLLVGYFIPGVRHFTGVSAGATNLAYREFALFAYTGAFFWVSTFLTVGYYFGDYCFACIQCIEITLDHALFAITFLGALVALYFVNRHRP